MTGNFEKIWGSLTKNGIWGTALLIQNEIRFHVSAFRSRGAEPYHNPTDSDLEDIEDSLIEAGEVLLDICCSAEEFESFKERFPFPDDYHGGKNSGVWNEKIFEHFLSAKLLDIDRYRPKDIFIDIAAGGSPWTLILRNHMNIEAYAIDMEVREPFLPYSFYRQEDATRTSFEPNSVKGLALHCAFEMFTGTSDSGAIAEFARILKPGGKALIVPLYMHTHNCTYSSPEYWGRGHGDPESHEYVRKDTRNIPCSRKYNAETLRRRILEPARLHGLTPRIHVLRNGRLLSSEIYCHFVLELEK